MKIRIGLVVALIFFGTSASVRAAFEITLAVQSELDKMKSMVSDWAVDAVVVKAVKDQNNKGPIPDMDNAKWKTIRRTDDVVKEFQSNPAGQYLKGKVASSNGAFTEAFLSASRGEKVAFVEKTTSYIHRGQPKFDVPYGSSKAWQGSPEFDESAQTYQIQISVPVLDGRKAIGALVVGVNLTHVAGSFRSQWRRQ